MLTLATGLYTDFGMCDFEPISCYNYLLYAIFAFSVKVKSIFFTLPGQIKGLTVIHHGISTVLL